MCFACTISTFANDKQSLVSYTNALLGRSRALFAAPKYYSMQHPILFSLLISSPLAVGQNRCPSICSCHRGVIRWLLLGRCVENRMLYKRAQNEMPPCKLQYFFSTSTCNRNIFWISSLQECLYILASIPGQNKNIFPDGIYTVWAVLKSCDQFY